MTDNISTIVARLAQLNEEQQKLLSELQLSQQSLQPDNDPFKLWRLDFHYGGIHKIAHNESLSVPRGVPGQLSLHTTMKIIANIFKRRLSGDIDEDIMDLITFTQPNNVPQWLNNQTYPGTDIEAWIKNHNIIAQFDIDWDESDTFFVTQNRVV